jgi:hypothetical protein
LIRPVWSWLELGAPHRAGMGDRQFDLFASDDARDGAPADLVEALLQHRGLVDADRSRVDRNGKPLCQQVHRQAAL